MKKLLITAVVAILGLMFLRNMGSGPEKTNYSIEHLGSMEIFNEKLESSTKYGYKNKALYILLEQDLRGLNNLRTQDFLILFKYGDKEVHFVPIVNGKSQSDKRVKYKMTFGGPIETSLAYGLEDEQGNKSVLSLESELGKEGTYVVKHVFEDDSTNYCKRGIIVES